jgi:hypothetical protein
MPHSASFYGIVAVLLALLIISSTAASMYYVQYQQESAQNQRHVGELSAALASYKSLLDSYNSSLGDYNTTLYLLATALGNLNTSTPAYRNAEVELSSLWSSYKALAGANGERAIAYEVRMLVDYGNGTYRWYNDTSIQPGWNAYVVSLVLLNGNIKATWYPQFSEHFIQGLNGVMANRENSWFVWVYNKTGWQLSQSGADVIPVYNGTIFAWTLCGYGSTYQPTCSP